MRHKGGTYRARFLLVLLLVVLAAAQTAAAAVAGNGNGGGGGGNPSTGGQHGQDCAPGYNDTATGSCEHNGAGGGNCGDNQSGNDNGLGNNGNDNGFGHKGEGCAAATPPPSNPPPAPTPPGNPNPPATPSSPHGDPSSGSPTPRSGSPTPPSVACAASLRVSRTRFSVGRRAILAVRVRGGDGSPLRGVTVLLRGAGLRLTAQTNASGIARLVLRPRSAGVIRIRLVQDASCASMSRLVRVTDIFKPPAPNFTG